ncbi:curli assembly chaperone CsgC, partial [Escherichia coli]|uniref:curli assembly chaperone CsgC n=6 Tax=Enterobacteriaceae TaxID=543 RepID=UPI003B83A7C4
MNALLLLAALSSQITFNTTQQGDMYTIIPEVTLTQSCLCRVQILSLREVKWSTKTGHRVRVFSSIDFPIRLVVT